MIQIAVTPTMRVAVHIVILFRLFRSRLPPFLQGTFERVGRLRKQPVHVRGGAAERRLVEEERSRVRDRVNGTVEVG